MVSVKELMAGTAIATLLGAGAASAQTFGANSGGAYVKAIGGFTIPQNEDFDLNEFGQETVGSGFDFDSGYALGLALGYEVNPSLVIEGEYMYRNAKVSLNDTGLGKNDGHSNALMVNALYKFAPMGVGGVFHPYAGAGIGGANLNVDAGEAGSLDGDWQFAYQLIGGVAYDINPQWSLTGEVRYFGINDQTVENDILSAKVPFRTFDFLVGAAYKF